MAAFSSHAIKTIPSFSFQKSVTAKRTSFLTPSNIKPSSPFVSSNHSLAKSLKLNSTLPHSSVTSVPKKSFTCRSQAQPVDSGRHTQFSILFFYSWNWTGVCLLHPLTSPFCFLCLITLQKKSKNWMCTRSTSETVEALFTLDWAIKVWIPSVI